jgi:carboxymethylenebutenolidase
MKRMLLLLAFLSAGCASTSTVTDRLESTPRHDEWAAVARDGRTIHTYVSYPEVATKAPVVILIHENRGLTDWVRAVADRLSEQGYIALAPDLLSGAAPNGGRTSDFASEDAAREAISKLSSEQVMSDLNAVAAYARSIPSASGKISVAGFCWGGARAFEYANRAEVPLVATHVFYGTGPQDPSSVESINGPVYGYYGGNDARVNATIPKTEELMRAANKSFEPVIYKDAGHAFLRSGEMADGSAENKKAAAEAWKRWLALLAQSR